MIQLAGVRRIVHPCARSVIACMKMMKWSLNQSGFVGIGTVEECQQAEIEGGSHFFYYPPQLLAPNVWSL